MLDTDYENFIVLYSCQESANYYDASDQERWPLIAYDDIWQHTRRLPNPSQDMSHTLTAFEVNTAMMIKEPIHKERIQILWRMPTFGDELHNRQD